MTPRRQKLIDVARSAGYTVEEKNGTIEIYRRGGRWNKIIHGLRIYPDGLAVSMTVAPSVQKVLRAYRDLYAVLGMVEE